ncbi:ABC transporter ATP-binding protein [Chelatococcus reniformis]|uniref:ABC transporter ATP-binding protein n=1 Tax=Chelatococcus reniformis TaxID=1494448 RepID=A0A916UTJ9_9HYPH|nr:ABC transporter ATP-binding protein [Chelatococcus reniformis]GGC87224.1 ABC transporter ATP-binding protein [Chelatococcus reniformis]
MSILLDLERLSVRYNRLTALSDVSLEARAGEVTTVIGPNGAGKTSLVNAVMGLIPSRGRVTFPLWPKAALSTGARVRARICLVPETRDLFGPMTVLDNLRLGAFVARSERGFDMEARLAEVARLFPRLDERRHQQAQTLSGGERQMLALGRALMLRPRFLMLDEPSLGLAPLVVAEIFRVIEQLKRDGVAILLIEQNARAALRVADHAYVLEGGEVQLQGSAATVMADARVVGAYLGMGRTGGAQGPVAEPPERIEGGLASGSEASRPARDAGVHHARTRPAIGAAS